MIGNWKKEQCAERPAELQTISYDTYIERKDIREVEYPEMDGEGIYTAWECTSREIGITEYWMLQSIKDIETSKAIDEYTMQLIEEGVI